MQFNGVESEEHLPEDLMTELTIAKRYRIKVQAKVAKTKEGLIIGHDMLKAIEVAVKLVNNHDPCS